MSVYKDEKKGTWYCKFRYTDWQGKRKETTKRGFKTKREAKEFEQDYTRKAIGDVDMTMNSLIDKYLEHQKANVRATSYRSIEVVSSKHIRPTLGKMKLSDITPNAIREWQLQIPSAYSPSTVKVFNRHLSAIQSFAVKFYGLDKNPIKVTGTSGRAESRTDFIEPADFNKLCSAISDPAFLLTVRILYYSGMRIGELYALTENDIDFTTNKITISKTWSDVEGKATPPKTKTSNRTIAMPKEIMHEIKHFFSTLYTIPNEPFHICHIRYYPQKLTALCEMAGIKKIHPHSLRHSHASYLIQHGVPITAISRRLGHASPDITLKVYSHCYKESDSDISALLSADICGQTVVKADKNKS